MKIGKMKCRVKCDLFESDKKICLKKDMIGFLYIDYDEYFKTNCILFEINETEKKILPLDYNWLFEGLK